MFYIEGIGYERTSICWPLFSPSIDTHHNWEERSKKKKKEKKKKKRKSQSYTTWFG
jgi:hypothetical protein